MKITLEFDGDETDLAEMSYRGPQMYSAAEDFRNYLRNTLKHNDKLSLEQINVLTDAQEVFFDHFGDLLRD